MALLGRSLGGVLVGVLLGICIAGLGVSVLFARGRGNSIASNRGVEVRLNGTREYMQLRAMVEEIHKNVRQQLNRSRTGLSPHAGPSKRDESSLQAVLGWSRPATSIGTGFAAVYLNRDVDVERRDRMKHGVAGLWDVERVRAVDGTQRANVVKRLVGSHQEAEASLQSLVKQSKQSADTVTKEVAVTISHLDALRRVACSDRPYGLVLEDDVTPELLPFWTRSLEEFTRKLPAGWNWLRLGTTAYDAGWRKLFERWNGEMAVSSVGIPISGAMAYVVPRSFAENVLRMRFVDGHECAHDSDLKIRLEGLPAYPCVVADDCVLQPLAGAHAYVATPPLFATPESRLHHPESTVRDMADDMKRLHIHSRTVSLDWAAHNFYECTKTADPQQRSRSGIDCGG